MPTEVKLPELGDGIESGDVLEIFVKVGDVIGQGDDIVEMETDKATVPVPTSVGGKVVRIAVKEGESVKIGGVLIEVEAETQAASKAEPPAAKPPSATQVTPPPAVSPPPAPVPASPAAVPAPAPTPVREPKPAVVHSAPVEPISAQKPLAVVPSLESTPSSATSGVVPAGPAIRRFAREVGIDLSAVAGSGEGGRITRDDVLSAVRRTNQSVSTRSAPAVSATVTTPVAATNAAPESTGTADRDDYGPIRVQRMTKIRKTIAAQMRLSWSTVPRVTNFDDADISDLERLRQSSKDDYAAQGLKLTTMPFLIKAVATALKHHPSINAVVDAENEQLIFKDYVNIGIAVDTDNGLVVPVLRDVDKMGIPDITRQLAEMAGKVRGGKFPVNDLRGGTFTISNLGAIGGQYSTPIVNVPEVAILLVGRSRKLPVVMADDSIQARLMMPLSLSYDHRLVDGSNAARFLNDIISYLEAPSRLLLAL